MGSRSKFLVLFLAAVFVLGGCATQQVDFREDVPQKLKPDHEEWQHFYVFGLVPSQQNRNVDQYCGGDQPVRIETELTFLNGLLSGVTYNIYSPRTLRVYCDMTEEMGPRK